MKCKFTRRWKKPSKVSRGSSRKYHPRSITRADATQGRLLQELVDAKSKEKNRILVDFERHCSLNKVPVREDSVIGCLGSMRAQGLADSTLNTYGVNILEALRRKRDPLRGLRGDVLKVLGERAARKPGKHADDHCFSLLLKSVMYFRPSIKTAAKLFIVAGLRWKDVQSIEWAGCLRNDCGLFVDIVITKQIRTPGERVTLHIPDEWIPKGFLDCIPSQGIVTNKSLSVMRTDMRKAGKQLGVKITSYSYRRNFMHRAIHRFTVKGKTDWKAVREKTLHFKEATLKAFYAKHVSDGKSFMSDPWL